MGSFYLDGKPGCSGGKIKWNGLLHWKCFGKTEDLQRQSSFLIFTRITGKSLYHLLRPTSTRLRDEIRGFASQIVEPRLSQKKCQLCEKRTRSSRSILFEENSYCSFLWKILTGFSIQMKSALCLYDSMLYCFCF